MNKTEFTEHHQFRTGLEIKQDAIKAGARIRASYVLDQETEHGSVRIGDEQSVDLSLRHEVRRPSRRIGLMTRADLVAGLEELGSVDQRPQPDGQVLALLEAQPVPGTARRSRVGFMLPDPVVARPPVSSRSYANPEREYPEQLDDSSVWK